MRIIINMKRYFNGNYNYNCPLLIPQISLNICLLFYLRLAELKIAELM